jgi:REP element-mobilizing transposase RayT
MSRGNHREKIFKDDFQKERFLYYLEHFSKKFNIKCYAYCVMENHFHIFLSTPEANLQKFMKNLNNAYANWYRKIDNDIGPVFSGRYKAILVDKDNYAVEVTNYIHMNPVRAGLVKKPADYKYSSIMFYINPVEDFFVDSFFILGFYGVSLKEASKKYLKQQNFFNEKKFKRTIYKKIAVGSNDFIEKIQKIISNNKTKKDIPVTGMIKVRSYKLIVDKIARYFYVSKDDFFIKKRLNLPRKILLYFLHKTTRLSTKEIGEKFNITSNAVCRNSRLIEENLVECEEIKKIVSDITHILRPDPN